MSRRDNLAGAAFLAPNLAGFLVFTLIPVGAALVLSLFSWDLFHSPHFVGLRNFRALLGWYSADGAVHASDPRFWKYLFNTLVFMIGLPISMALSLGLAIMLNQRMPGRMIFRTVYFLPTACAGVAIMLLWKFFYDPDFGLINALLQRVGLVGPHWLTDYHWAKPAIIIMEVWGAMGGTNMILYLAGLQSIPQTLYEAAAIDGASAWRQFRHITLPMLAPTTFFILITGLIAGFQGEFDTAYVMTQGGPDGATTSLSYYIYNQAFQYFNMGYAAAIAVVLFAVIFVVTLLNWRFVGGQVQYV